MPNRRYKDLCIVPSCKKKDYRLHYLPLDEKRGLEWLQILGIREFENKPYKEIRAYGITICNAHFDDSQFNSIERHMLNKYTAKPSLNPSISYVIPPRSKRGKAPHIIVKDDGSKVLTTNNKLQEVFKISDTGVEKISSIEETSLNTSDRICTPGSSKDCMHNPAIMAVKEGSSDADEMQRLVQPEQEMLPGSMFKDEPMDITDDWTAELQDNTFDSSTFNPELLDIFDETSTQSQKLLDGGESSEDIETEELYKPYGRVCRGGIQCTLCHKYYKNQELFDKHLILEKALSCLLCFRSFSSLGALFRHVRKNHSKMKGLPHCRRCKQFFETNVERDEHLKTCDKCLVIRKSLKRFQCGVCSGKFPTKYFLTSHIKEKHGFLFKSQNVACYSKILSTQIFYPKLKSRLDEHPNCTFVVYCRTCDKDIRYDEYFSTHYEQCFLKPNFTCPFCNVSKENLRTDNIRNHLDGHLTLSNTLSKCEECNVAFFNCINYFTHNTNVHANIRSSVPIAECRINKKMKPEMWLQPSKSKAALQKQVIAISERVTKATEISDLENVPTLSIPETSPRTIKLIDPVHINRNKCYSKNVFESVKSVNEIIANEEVVNAEHAYCANTTDVATYFCAKCDDEIPKSQMARHISLHLYKCPFCTQVFCSANNITSHMGLPPTSVTDVYEFLANEAFYERNKNILLSSQKRVVYLVEKPRLVEYIDENRCKVCYVKFQFHCQLLRHQVFLKHDIDVIQCGVCETKFCSKFMYDHHLTLHSEEKVYCQMCRTYLPTIDLFMKHINSYLHLEDNTFGVECMFCYDMKLNEEKLLKHNDKYHKDGKYWCRICDTKFDSLSLLDAHRAYLHNILKFSCKKCRAQFSIKQYEELHALHCQA